MTAEQPRVSGDLLRLMVTHGSADKLLAEHAPDGKGRCPVCRSHGCTLYNTAVVAKRMSEGGSGA